jgi:hypothetical protein
MGALLVFSGIVSDHEAKSTNGTEDGKRINSSANNPNPNPITISNGQILSRALLLDPSIILAAKQAVQNGTNNDLVLQNSIDQLLSQANSFLSLRPTSLFDKGEIPASGDKHDFLSLAPYRWPDPDKPDGLPYVNIAR